MVQAKAQELSFIDWKCFISDGWSNRVFKHFTASYLVYLNSEFEFDYALLEVSPITTDSKAATLKTLHDASLAAYGVDIATVPSACVDGGKNYQNAVAGHEVITCGGHTMDHVVKDAVKLTPAVLAVANKCSRYATVTHQSYKKQLELEAELKKLSLPISKVQQWSPTRFLGVYAFFLTPYFRPTYIPFI